MAFFKTDLAKNGQKNYVTMNKQKSIFELQILFYNFLESFSSILSFLGHLCKKLGEKKTEICSFSQNFDRELINYSGILIDTDMRYFAKVTQCNLVRCPPRRGASRPSSKFSVGKSPPPSGNLGLKQHNFAKAQYFLYVVFALFS